MYEAQHDHGGSTDQRLWSSAGLALAAGPENLSWGPGGAKPPLVCLCLMGTGGARERPGVGGGSVWVRTVRVRVAVAACSVSLAAVCAWTLPCALLAALCLLSLCVARDCGGVRTSVKRWFRAARAPLNVLRVCPGIAAMRVVQGGVSIVCPFQ